MKKLSLVFFLLLVLACNDPSLPENNKNYGILRIENNYPNSSYFFILKLNIANQNIQLSNNTIKEIGLTEGVYQIQGTLYHPLMDKTFLINESIIIVAGMKIVKSWP